MTFDAPDEALQWWRWERRRRTAIGAFDPVAIRGLSFARVCPAVPMRPNLTVNPAPSIVISQNFSERLLRNSK